MAAICSKKAVAPFQRGRLGADNNVAKPKRLEALEKDVRARVALVVSASTETPMLRRPLSGHV